MQFDLLHAVTQPDVQVHKTKRGAAQRHHPAIDVEPQANSEHQQSADQCIYKLGTEPLLRRDRVVEFGFTQLADGFFAILDRQIRADVKGNQLDQCPYPTNQLWRFVGIGTILELDRDSHAIEDDREPDDRKGEHQGQQIFKHGGSGQTSMLTILRMKTYPINSSMKITSSTP